jgi:putative membrane protein insertion efficiency factor
MMARIVAGALRTYKVLISPLLPRSCRFMPTCSEYAAMAIDVHGLGHGSVLAVKRLLRCHPFTPGGYDPPPGHREYS